MAYLPTKLGCFILFSIVILNFETSAADARIINAYESIAGAQPLMFQEILGVHEAKYPQKSDEPEQVFFDYFKRALPAVDVRPRFGAPPCRWKLCVK
ncbi:unnamed protein product [Enterobius vermicularis]|uniref:Uncharacterized protein n=1 Tax=Enterobius vermicularis TaxID=51028 RepID=A0A0N4VBN4_ENTVE|nr:unnamed protein product [Enterobius vermicularis]